jgi:hypothetical protein
MFGLRVRAILVFCLVRGMKRVWMNGTLKYVSSYPTWNLAVSDFSSPTSRHEFATYRSALPRTTPHRPTTSGAPRTAPPSLDGSRPHRATLRSYWPRRAALPSLLRLHPNTGSLRDGGCARPRSCSPWPPPRAVARPDPNETEVATNGREEETELAMSSIWTALVRRISRTRI